MKQSQPLQKNEFNSASQLHLLDRVMDGVIEALDKGRSEIFAIAQECRQQQENAYKELAEIAAEKEQLLKDLAEAEREEQEARHRLMEVSRNFYTFSEEDIKAAYEEARLIQVSVLDYKQREIYLHRRNDELNHQIKQIEAIAERAGQLLSYTSVAVKLLKGNINKISDALEGVNRRQQIEMWIIESQESERRKIARDLHDGPAQSLASMLIRLDLIERLIAKEDQPAFIDELHKAEEMGRESLAEIRRIMFDLKPTFIHEDGFISTLKDYFNSYEAKYNMEIDFMIIGKIRKYELSLEIALFRIVQEAVTNARKHSGATQVTVRIEDVGNYLQLSIQDEGKGFDLAKMNSVPESYGIIGMKERVELFGGVIDLISSPGAGTQVHVKLPLEKEAYHGEHKGSHSR